MKFLVSTILLALAAPALAADAQKSPLYWTYQYVIATSDEELSVAQMVFDLPGMHPEMCDREMLDLLAELLVNADVDDPSYRPGIKEIFGILEMRDAARYRTVASQVANKSKDSNISALAGRYAKRHKETVPQYVPGTIDRAALRRQYARDALAARHPTELAVSLATLPLNVGVERQFAIAGKPDAVVGYQRRMTDGLLIHIRTPYMFHYYRGIGRVTYQYKNGIGWLMRKVTINPLAFEPLMPYRDFAAEFKLPDDESLEMTMLLSGDGPSAQTAAKNNHDRQKAPPQIILDTTAELLLAKYQSPLEIDQRDAYGWFCRLLSHKGGPRYAKVLETVEAGAADEKLRRWAALAVDPAPGADPTPYVPGSIEVADLARLYPVPYPPITMPRIQ
ncbi:MAG TPA: hypothetical protein VFZ95_04985 [Steroidobacteraceae bacterium]